MKDELSIKELLKRDRGHWATLREEKRKLEEQIRELQVRVAEIMTQQEKVEWRIEAREYELGLPCTENLKEALKNDK